MAVEFCVGYDLIFYNNRLNILTRALPSPCGLPSGGSMILYNYGPCVFQEW